MPRESALPLPPRRVSAAQVRAGGGALPWRAPLPRALLAPGRTLASAPPRVAVRTSRPLSTCGASSPEGPARFDLPAPWPPGGRRAVPTPRSWRRAVRERSARGLGRALAARVGPRLPGDCPEEVAPPGGPAGRARGLARRGGRGSPCLGKLGQGEEGRLGRPGPAGSGGGARTRSQGRARSGGRRGALGQARGPWEL